MEDTIGDTSPWKGSLIRRVFEWNWNLGRMDCLPHPLDRGPVYQVWAVIMRELNYIV